MPHKPEYRCVLTLFELVQLHQSQFERACQRLHTIAGTQLREQMRDVRFHRLLAYAQLVGNLSIRRAAR